MVNNARSSHIGTAYSMTDLLAVLYGSVLKIDPTQPDWPDRDRFILSKGHGCTALYASLAERGFFPLDWLETFYQNGSPLVGHATHSHVPGVEVSTGSLGHGLSIASGMALAAQRDNRQHRVFVMLSDGECNEGSTWEAILFAGHQKLSNLVAIVDYNKIQSLGRVEDVLDLEPMADKWRAARWAVREIDGHDFTQVQDVFAALPFEPGKPNCVIAHTVKGKGVSFMENSLLWHYRSPDPDEYAKAMQELGE
jgi:transketolase